MSDDPTDPTDPEPATVTNDSIAESIFKHLSEDESLTDDDRKAISEGVITKAGGKLPEPVRPKSTHWSDRKLW
jgi:hypothetical protein